MEDANVEKTVEAIRKVHPYEEPLINVIQLGKMGYSSKIVGNH